MDEAADPSVPVRCRAAIAWGHPGGEPVRAVRRWWGGVHLSPASAASATGAAWPAVAMPAHAALVRRVRAPLSSRAKARKVFPSLLDIQLPFPIEESVVAILDPVRTADGQYEALAVAARREDVAAELARWQAAGVDPWVMDHEALALWQQGVRELPLDRRAKRVLCHVAPGHTTLVWGNACGVQAATGLRVGAVAYGDSEQGAAAMGQLAARARAFLRSPGLEVSAFEWIWCGPGACRPDQVARLATALELPAGAQTSIHREGSGLLARGVAYRAVAGGPSACNVRTGAQAHPLLVRTLSRRVRRAALWLLLSAGALVAASTWGSHTVAVRRAALQAAIRDRARELTGGVPAPRGQELLAAERAMAERASALDAVRAVFAPPLAGIVRSLLSQAAAAGLVLEAVVAEPQLLILTGSAADWADGERLAALLQADGWVASLQRRDAGADERVHFELRAQR